MSSYIKKMRNKQTSQIQEVYCIDDYFPTPPLVYGYQPILNGESDGEILTTKQLKERFEDV